MDQDIKNSQAGQTPEQGGPRTKKWRELAGNESLPAPSPEKAGAMSAKDFYYKWGRVFSLESDENLELAWSFAEAYAAHSTQALREERDRYEKKWREYEQNYILPCFQWAKDVGMDLQRLVKENAGKNCVQLLVEALRQRVAELERERDSWRRVAEKLESEKQALGRTVAELRELVKSLIMFVPPGHPLHARWAALADLKEPKDPKGVALVPEDGFKAPAGETDKA